jgi:hypothetical protein
MSSRRWSYAACLPVVFLLIAGFARLLLSEPPSEPPSAPIVDPAMAEQLRALGYADWVDAGDDPSLVQGVTLHESELAYDGYNLYNSRWRDRAYLIDMKGEVAHTWFAPGLGGNWHHIEMLPSGELLTIHKDGYLAKLDWNSKLLWKRELFTHHDIATDESGEIWVLTHDFAEIPFGDGKIPILDDYIVALSPEGEVLRKFSVFELFGDAVKESRFEAIARVMNKTGREGIEEKRSLLDLFHTNTLERLDRDIGGMKTRGDFLICPKHLDLVAIVDLETNRVEWSWGDGELQGPHQPSVISNGNILIFDNGGGRKYSRLVEVDPATNEIVWQYKADPPESFYSATRGGAQELPNGNILVTESDKGRVFEITRDGRTVWEFYNPDLQKAGKFVRGAIYRMMRFEGSAVAPLLGLASEHHPTSVESADESSGNSGGH